jgi:phosphate uptake regulator
MHRRRSNLPQLSGKVSQREDTVDRIVKLIMEVERRDR